jgi:hypothetical protein
MKNIFLFLAAAFVLASCSKKIDELPGFTENGEGTFGAKVNGALWAPRGFGIVPTGPILEGRYVGNNSVTVNARDYSKQPNETEFEIYIKDLNGPGTYNLNQNTAKHPAGTTASYGYYVERRLHPLNEWITNELNTGTVTITKWDPATGILAGSFQFKAANTDDPNDVLTVTEGRFDVIVK